MLEELPWISEARKHLGLREIRGEKHNPVILSWLSRVKAWWRDDETPWCGTFVDHCLDVGKATRVKEGYRAKSYLNLPVRLNIPCYGAIAVFDFAPRGGHAGFIVGTNAAGHLMILGGNQNNEVSIAPFSTERLIGIRWPSVYPSAGRFTLPRLTNTGAPTENVV